MAILTEDECRAIMKKALSYSKADECEINLNGSDSANIRYARNTVSTSGAISSTSMAISSAFGKKLGVITLNEYTDEAIESCRKKIRRAGQTGTRKPGIHAIFRPANIRHHRPKLCARNSGYNTCTAHHYGGRKACK
jgi:predicted Zn-dependent protease